MAEVAIGTGPRAYLRLLRHGPAARPFLAAIIARLPLAMAPIGMLVLVQHARSAYAIAGVVTGAYAIGCALGTPLWGRLMDRHGQIRVLLPTALVSGGLMIALAVATVGGVHPVGLVALAAGAGLAYPPVSPAIRAAWRVVFRDPASRKVAFALDATSVEMIFVGGPLLLSALLALLPPVVPLIVTAALMIGGVGAYCRTSAARGASSRHDVAQAATAHGPKSVVFASGVGAVLLVMLALSVGFGQLDTSMAATAGELLGGSDHVGILFAFIAGGSTIGGLVYGARDWKVDERIAVPVLLGTFAICLGAMALLLSTGHAGLGVLLPLLFCTGLSIAPTLIMQQALLDHLAPGHRLNEAQAFLSASNTTGAAAGTALAGLLIDGYGLTFSFGGAAVFAALSSLIAFGARPRWRRAMTLRPSPDHHDPAASDRPADRLAA
ncbi:MFS family permease [Friedmanniella endophytica]|uniref:MFS family permease n=1 Tax=Microlunatus kandeliicorticis TaxID=1759536 RepID=A0A7W3P519_9ACTN|nr:MFS transporter [Microlunatus kandeliicorticis]MBA8793392.1 MFS family permease [Microlunatus kandeliicorticis]